MERWFGAVAAGALAAVAACSQASSSHAKNPGDDIITDVEASTMPPEPDAADYDDGFFNGTDLEALNCTKTAPPPLPR